MEQKDYKLEIVLLLLKQPLHAREIARSLKTNHMTVNRKLKQLMKDNVVDYKQEGKNKRFSIKTSIEARAFVIIAEEYKLMRDTCKNPMLRRIVNKVQQDTRISLALIFGSHAKGFAREESDIDLYLDTKDLKIRQEYQLFDEKLHIQIGELSIESALFSEMSREHIIVKGVEQWYDQPKLPGFSSP
jgi:predicted nucleotidyltransferase